MNVFRSMCRTTGRVIVAIGAIAVVVACAGSVEPKGALSGEYDLLQVSGTVLPARYLVYGFGGQSYRYALGGTLQFTGRDRVIDTRRLSDQPQGTEPYEFTYVDTSTYELEDGTLIIPRPGIPGVLAPHSDTGYVDGDIIILPVRTVEGEIALTRTLTYLKR